MTRVCPSIGTLAVAGIIAIAFAAAPVGIDYNFTPEIESAFAKGKGSGKSGSKGSKSSKSSKSGGHGKSGGDDGTGVDQAHKGKNKSDSVEASLDDHDDDDGKIGNGHIKAKGNGHQKHHDGDALHDGDDGDKNLLGNLNAAHASANARENASDNSMVGLLAIYAAEADGMTAEEARAALGAISNKSSFEQSFNEGAGADVVDQEVVTEVNTLLDVTNKAPADEEEEE
jgi:hypothetical protein